MMKSHFLSLVLCGAALLTTTAAHSQPKPLEVSNDNFVSLRWTRSGGFAGVFESYTIQNHEIIKHNGAARLGEASEKARSQFLPRAVPLSENQWKELLAQLKTADVPAIAGTYKQPFLSDGFSESLGLTLSDGDNLDQTFSVSNYGAKAPSAYYKFSAFLTELLSRKFPATR